VVGSGPQVEQIIKFLNERSRLGMLPVLIVDGDIPYEKSALACINRSNISTVILVTSEMSEELQTSFINDQRYGYHRRRGERSVNRLILISDIGSVSSLGIVPYDLEGMLGLGVQQNLLNRWPNLIKRLIDLTLAVIAGIISAPFLLVIMALICLDSPEEFSTGKIGWDVMAPFSRCGSSGPCRSMRISSWTNTWLKIRKRRRNGIAPRN
jgi:hypothetical protein